MGSSQITTGRNHFISYIREDSKQLSYGLREPQKDANIPKESFSKSSITANNLHVIKKRNSLFVFFFYEITNTILYGFAELLKSPHIK